jgi:tungstate transport system substrate-binding protein|nr:hypothetical protein [Kofleriaceae bacterium]
MPRRPSRRAFVGGVGGAAALLAACRGAASEPAPVEHQQPAAPPAPPIAFAANLVRVGSVPTAVEGDLLPKLLADFPTRTALTASPDVYKLARSGQLDVIVSHYGHHDCEQFVLDGLGEWPRTVFSNQMAFVGPTSDPAKIRGLTDAADALARIARARAPFVLNDLDGIRYLAELLWHAAGKPPRDGWWLDAKHQKEDAMAFASRIGGYSLWGLTPFLRTHASASIKLEPLVLADPLLQRLLVTVVVRGGNVEGARALQSYLLEPATQARIRAMPYPTSGLAALWVPQGRHNGTAALPLPKKA